MAALHHIERAPGVLTVTMTRWGRLLAGGRAFVLTLGIALAMLVVFYLPDYLADYGHRGRAFESFFAVYLVSTALLVAAVAGVMKALAATRLSVNVREGTVSFWMKTALGRLIEDTVEAGAVSGVSLELKPRWWRSHRVIVAVSGGHALLLARSVGHRDELERVRSAVADALDAARETQRKAASRR